MPIKCLDSGWMPGMLSVSNDYHFRRVLEAPQIWQIKQLFLFGPGGVAGGLHRPESLARKYTAAVWRFLLRQWFGRAVVRYVFSLEEIWEYPGKMLKPRGCYECVLFSLGQGKSQREQPKLRAL